MGFYVSAELISIFCTAYEINSDWILTGNGGIRRNIDVKNAIPDELPTLLSVIERKDERIELLNKEIGKLGEQIKQLKENRVLDTMFPNTSNNVSELPKEVQELPNNSNTQGLIAAEEHTKYENHKKNSHKNT